MKTLYIILVVFLAGCEIPQGLEEQTRSPGSGNKSIEKEPGDIRPATIAKTQSAKPLKSFKYIKAYLQDGGNPNVWNLYEGWPLIIGVVKAGRLKDVQALINAGADVTAPHLEGGDTALHYLAWSKSIDPGIQLKIGALLLEGGADVNATNNKGQTPLMFASLQGLTGFVRYLLDSGANPGRLDASSRSAEWYARNYGHTAIAEILRKTLHHYDRIN